MPRMQEPPRKRTAAQEVQVQAMGRSAGRYIAGSTGSGVTVS